jgi:seryl-tRNA synthetase
LEEHEPTTHKKQVQWGENIEHVFDKTQSIYESALIKKVQALDEKIDSLTHTVESLTHNMELMIQKFDAMINPPITKSIVE